MHICVYTHVHVAQCLYTYCMCTCWLMHACACLIAILAYLSAESRAKDSAKSAAGQQGRVHQSLHGCTTGLRGESAGPFVQRYYGGRTTCTMQGWVWSSGVGSSMLGWIRLHGYMRPSGTFKNASETGKACPVSSGQRDICAEQPRISTTHSSAVVEGSYQEAPKFGGSVRA